MSPDVKELAGEKLSGGQFPADPRADFRLHMSPEVCRGIEQHAKSDVSIEICGVLVGHWETDENGPFARVTNIIRCENASSKFAEVTFTHESWAQINKEMDSRFADLRIIGWYHSHPDFGIFLSDRDCFIQQHFFCGPGQIAYVVDPVRNLEGVFIWRNGKPTLLPNFWVGDRIRTADASERSATESGHSPSAKQAASARVDDASPGFSTLGVASAALALLVAFWLGHLYGNWRTQWEQRMIIEGAVAHFADTKIIANGLEEALAAMQVRLAAVAEEIDKLPDPAAQLTQEQAEEAAQVRARIQEKMAICNAAMQSIVRQFALSDIERDTLARIAAQRQAALRKQIDALEARAKEEKQAVASPASEPSSNKEKSRVEAVPPENASGSPETPTPERPTK